MKIFKNQKGFVQHPVFLFLIAVIIGLILAWVWIKYINIPNPYCNK